MQYPERNPGTKYGWRHRDIVESAYQAYIHYAWRTISHEGRLLGTRNYAKSFGRRPERADKVFELSQKFFQPYVVKRISHNLFVVFDWKLEIPVSEPLPLEQACQRCREYNR